MSNLCYCILGCRRRVIRMNCFIPGIYQQYNIKQCIILQLATPTDMCLLARMLAYMPWCVLGCRRRMIRMSCFIPGIYQQYNIKSVYNTSISYSDRHMSPSHGDIYSTIHISRAQSCLSRTPVYMPLFTDCDAPSTS